MEENILEARAEFNNVIDPESTTAFSCESFDGSSDPAVNAP